MNIHNTLLWILIYHLSHTSYVKCADSTSTGGDNSSEPPIKLYSGDSDDESKLQELDKSKYEVKKLGSRFDFELKNDSKCTLVKFDGKKLWKHKDHGCDDHPSTVSYRSEHKIVIHLGSNFITYEKKSDGTWGEGLPSEGIMSKSSSGGTQGSGGGVGGQDGSGGGGGTGTGTPGSGTPTGGAGGGTDNENSGTGTGGGAGGQDGGSDGSGEASGGTGTPTTPSGGATSGGGAGQGTGTEGSSSHGEKDTSSTTSGSNPGSGTPTGGARGGTSPSSGGTLTNPGSDSGTKTGVELDIKNNTSSTNEFDHNKSGKVVTYTAKGDNAFKSVNQGNNVIWSTTNSNDFANKVVLEGKGQKSKKVTIHLLNNTTKVYKREGKGKAWVEQSQSSDSQPTPNGATDISTAHTTS